MCIRDRHTRLLVAADGARSTVREALGIVAREHDYRQTLFVTRLRTQRPPDGTAYERLTAHGPTALLPRGDGHYGLVHGVPSDQADAVAALDDGAFLARVQDAFGWRAGRFVSVGPRSLYPVSYTHLDVYKRQTRVSAAMKISAASISGPAAGVEAWLFICGLFIGVLFISVFRCMCSGAVLSLIHI